VAWELLCNLTELTYQSSKMWSPLNQDFTQMCAAGTKRIKTSYSKSIRRKFTKQIGRRTTLKMLKKCTCLHNLRNRWSKGRARLR
jgi:hypothetical protein